MACASSSAEKALWPLADVFGTVLDHCTLHGEHASRSRLWSALRPCLALLRVVGAVAACLACAICLVHRFGPSDHVPLRIYYEYTTGGKTPSHLSSSKLAVAAKVMKRSELESLSNAVLRGAETNWHLSSPPC